VETVTAAGSPGTGDAARRPALVFVGFMGAGKSTAARAVAAALGERAWNSDTELESALGEPIEDFFDREGEEEFRRREEDVAVELLQRPDARVVSLGGGTLGSPAVRDALDGHTVVHLEVDAATAWQRAAGRGRPLARDRERFESLLTERRPVYEGVAAATLPAADRGMAVRALPALLALADAPAGTRLVWASSRSGDHPVFAGHGLIASGFFHPLDTRRFAITDANVAGLHRVEADWTHEIPPGESEKTLARTEEVLRAMANAGVSREDIAVAVGGGVVGDLAGFCAAVYQRGIAYVQVPTSLVAQVDSAYGGKTGVDLPEAKNYAGAYHLPAAVLVDPAALETLPKEELAAGYAEVVKTALIAGGGLWERVRTGADPDLELVLGCVRTKLAVVAEDERDDGRRQVLNLGHTIGHAVEAATGYRQFRHGEAVGIGLLCALRLSGQEDLRLRVAELLRARGLPLGCSGLNPDAIIEHVQRDKKRRGDRVPFVLVEAPGAVTHGHDVSEAELRAAIEEACES
jgi:shikimate kinase / 3-dehydroquinate synthase